MMSPPDPAIEPPLSVRAIIFDLGNVLLPFDHSRMVRGVADLYQADAADVQAYLLGDDRLFFQMENGDFGSRELHRRVNARFGDQLFAAFAEAASDIFTPDERMSSLVSSLKQAGYRLVLLSNTSDLHIDFIRRQFTLLNAFDDLVLSYEVKCSKPAAAIYEHAIAAAGQPAARCLFIDDREENVAGAEAVGIRSHHFVGHGEMLSWLSRQGVRVEVH